MSLEECNQGANSEIKRFRGKQVTEQTTATKAGDDEQETKARPGRKSGAPIVWIDCEMTGLDPAVDEIVEIAVIITDSDLKPLAPGMDLVIKPSPESVAQMDEFVVNMHTESGLINQLDDGVPVAEAERAVLEYIENLVPEVGLAPLAGNSVGQDLRFLRKYMPRVASHLSYRIIDVSSIKELAKRWYERVYVCYPEKTGGHRALGDIEDSIAELEYYRRALFPAELNPQRGFYHDLADQVVEDLNWDGASS